MDGLHLIEYVARTERFIERSEELLKRQQALFESLKRDGHAKAAVKAEQLLLQFEEIRTRQLLELDRLRALLHAQQQAGN